jgi:hypothetical protein
MPQRSFSEIIESGLAVARDQPPPVFNVSGSTVGWIALLALIGIGGYFLFSGVSNTASSLEKDISSFGGLSNDFGNLSKDLSGLFSGFNIPLANIKIPTSTVANDVTHIISIGGKAGNALNNQPIINKNGSVDLTTLVTNSGFNDLSQATSGFTKPVPTSGLSIILDPSTGKAVSSTLSTSLVNEAQNPKVQSAVKSLLSTSGLSLLSLATAGVSKPLPAAATAPNSQVLSNGVNAMTTNMTGSSNAKKTPSPAPPITMSIAKTATDTNLASALSQAFGSAYDSLGAADLVKSVGQLGSTASADLDLPFLSDTFQEVIGKTAVGSSSNSVSYL